MSTKGNTARALLAATLIVASVVAGITLLERDDSYYITANCGQMGTYKLVPGSIQATKVPGMDAGELFDELGIVKFPSYCVVRTHNFPSTLTRTPAKKRAPEQGL